MVAEARGALAFVQSESRERKVQLEGLAQQLNELQLRRDLREKISAHRSATESVVRLQAKSNAEERARIDELEKTIDLLDTHIRDLKLDIAKEEELVNAKSRTLVKTKEAITALTTAISQARVAASSVEDSQLDTAVGDLKETKANIETQAAGDEAKLESAKESLANIRTALSDSVAKRRNAKSALTKLNKDLDTARSEMEGAAEEARQAEIAVDSASTDLRKSSERRFAVRTLAALSPEQMAGATIAALELQERFKKEANGEWDRNNKDKKPETISAEEKQREIDTLIQKRREQVISAYVSLYAAPGGAPQDVFSATADQALFFANDGRVQNWLSPSNGTLMKRLQEFKDNIALADEVYLAILSRKATSEEQAQVAAYLSEREKDRARAIREIAWGLLSSLEFRFNH